MAGLAATAVAAALVLGGGGAAVAQDCAGADTVPAGDPAALASAVACLVNQARSDAGLPRLPQDARLDAAARAHAGVMVREDAFSTTEPDGSTPRRRAAAAGYPAAAVGETIAFGTGSLGTPRRIVDGWLADGTSRGRLLAAAGAAIGSGAVTGTPGNAGGDGATYVVDVASKETTGGTATGAAVAGKSAVAQVLRGVVYILTPGGTRTVLRAAPARAAAYQRLAGKVTIPMGSRVDTRAGTVKVTTAADRAGTQQSLSFRDGIVRMTQARSGDLVVNLQLVQPLASCGTGATASAAASKQKSPRRKTKKRSLFGSGKGRYRTRGRYASATVRGTQWTTTDTCAGTKVSVRRGIVDVKDLRSGKVVTVKAGRAVLVPRKRTG